MKKRCELVPVPALSLQVQPAYLVQECGANSDALPLGHDYQAGSPVMASLEHGANRQMRNGFITYKSNEVLSGHRIGQI